MVSDDELRKKAKERAKEKIGFYVHFLIYVLVNSFLFVQWYWITGGEGFPWVITTTLGWGIGVVAHFVGVFVIAPRSEKLEEKEYRKLKDENK
jgi:uncharacterized protein (DUF486 family)